MHTAHACQEAGRIHGALPTTHFLCSPLLLALARKTTVDTAKMMKATVKAPTPVEPTCHGHINDERIQTCSVCAPAPHNKILCAIEHAHPPTGSFSCSVGHVCRTPFAQHSHPNPMSPSAVMMTEHNTSALQAAQQILAAKTARDRQFMTANVCSRGASISGVTRVPQGHPLVVREPPRQSRPKKPIAPVAAVCTIPPLAVRAAAGTPAAAGGAAAAGTAAGPRHRGMRG